MRSFKLAQRFKNISIAKKLYFTVGTMALLIGIELLSLFFCLNTLGVCQRSCPVPIRRRL
jgi:hypothetical protein